MMSAQRFFCITRLAPFDCCAGYTYDVLLRGQPGLYACAPVEVCHDTQNLQGNTNSPTNIPNFERRAAAAGLKPLAAARATNIRNAAPQTFGNSTGERSRRVLSLVRFPNCKLNLPYDLKDTEQQLFFLGFLSTIRVVDPSGIVKEALSCFLQSWDCQGCAVLLLTIFLSFFLSFFLSLK